MKIMEFSLSEKSLIVLKYGLLISFLFFIFIFMLFLFYSTQETKAQIENPENITYTSLSETQGIVVPQLRRPAGDIQIANIAIYNEIWSGQGVVFTQ
jgi:hypothetical protein